MTISGIWYINNIGDSKESDAALQPTGRVGPDFWVGQSSLERPKLQGKNTVDYQTTLIKLLLLTMQIGKTEWSVDGNTPTLEAAQNTYMFALTDGRFLSLLLNRGKTSQLC